MDLDAYIRCIHDFFLPNTDCIIQQGKEGAHVTIKKGYNYLQVS